LYISLCNRSSHNPYAALGSLRYVLSGYERSFLVCVLGGNKNLWVMDYERFDCISCPCVLSPTANSNFAISNKKDLWRLPTILKALSRHEYNASNYTHPPPSPRYIPVGIRGCALNSSTGRCSSCPYSRRGHFGKDGMRLSDVTNHHSLGCSRPLPPCPLRKKERRSTSITNATRCSILRPSCKG